MRYSLTNPWSLPKLFLFVTLLSLVSLLPVAGPANADSCSDILTGIWDINSASGSSTQADSWSRWFCSTDNSKLEDISNNSSNFGFNVGIPIDEIPVSVGASTSDANGTQHSIEKLKSFCSSDAGRTYLARQFQKYSQQSNPAVVTAWTQCINNQKGIYLTALYTNDDKVVWIRSHNAAGIVHVKKPKLDNLTCDDELKPGLQLVANQYFVCRYSDPSNGASLTISILDAEAAAGVSQPQPVILPGIPKPSGPVQPAFDISGRAKPPGSQDIVTIQQTGPTVTWDYPQLQYNHHFVGTYVTPTTVIGSQTRILKTDMDQNGTTIKAGCVVTMIIRLEVNGKNDFCEYGAVVGDQSCDLHPHFTEKNCGYNYGP